jgi:hypothetical protein
LLPADSIEAPSTRLMRKSGTSGTNNSRLSRGLPASFELATLAGAQGR